MIRGKCASAVALAVVGMGVVSSTSSAALVYDSGGFESPRFTNNANLEGQDVTFGPWFRDNNNTSTAVLQTAVSVSGQAVRATRAAAPGSDSNWGVVKNLVPSERYVTVQWEQKTLQTSLGGLTFGPFIGIRAFDAVGLSFPLIGSLGVDASTGELLVQDGTTGAIEPVDAGTVVNFANPNFDSFALQIDYDTDTYQSFFNGVLVDTETFVDGPILGFSDADISVLNIEAGKDAVSTGIGFFDNYRINTSNIPIVPEPTMFGVVAVATAGLLGRRRR